MSVVRGTRTTTLLWYAGVSQRPIYNVGLRHIIVA